jgi:hypothetical protein
MSIRFIHDIARIFTLAAGNFNEAGKPEWQPKRPK